MTPTITLKSADFVESVLRLQPQLAVFDCDGTLWAGDAGERFFDWELKRGLLPDDIANWARARYADYKSGNVSEEDMCGEMVTIHAGLSESDLRTAATQFFDENFVTQIFPEMQELVSRLQTRGVRCLGSLFDQRVGNSGGNEALRHRQEEDTSCVGRD